MERDELNRLREAFERLYQLPEIDYQRNTVSISADDRPALLQRLQALWQTARAFMVEGKAKLNYSGGSDGFCQESLQWWQLHHLRMGNSPLFSRRPE